MNSNFALFALCLSTSIIVGNGGTKDDLLQHGGMLLMVYFILSAEVALTIAFGLAFGYISHYWLAIPIAWAILASVPVMFALKIVADVSAKEKAATALQEKSKNDK